MRMLDLNICIIVLHELKQIKYLKCGIYINDNREILITKRNWMLNAYFNDFA